MFGDFVSFLFLLAMICTGVIVFWEIKNDRVGLLEPLKGLLAIKDDASPPAAALRAEQLRKIEDEFTLRRHAQRKDLEQRKRQGPTPRS